MKTSPKKKFKLEGGEQALVDALSIGEPCVFQYKGEHAEPKSKRRLRADILGRILRSEIVDGEKAAINLPRAVLIYGAFIQGPLDMSDTDTGLTLIIQHSKFDSEIDFTRAKLAALSLEHSDLAGADMGFIETQSHLYLGDIQNRGPLELQYAKINGQFSAVSKTRQTRFINPNGQAINAQGTKIAADVFLRGAHIEGTAAFNSAEIGGQFAAESLEKHITRFINPKGQALNAQGAKIAADVFLNGARIEGIANFNGAEISGQFSASSIEEHITRFINPNGQAIYAQGAKIAAGVYLRGAHIEGIADFSSAEIGGQFSARSLEEHITRFINPKGLAINAQGAKIAGTVFLDGAHIEGTADFNSAEIGVQFVADKTSFISISGAALSLEGAMISGHCWLDNLAHRPVGAINLRSARLATVYIDKNTYPFGPLILEGTTYKNWEFLNPTPSPVGVGEGWLTPSKSKVFEKIKDKTYPKGAIIAFNALNRLLNGVGIENPYSYHIAIAVLDRNIKSMNSETRSPFAYRQFSKVLDANGHEREARDVRVLAGAAYTERTVKTLTPKILRTPYRVWRWLLRGTTGFGAKPWRVLNWLVGAWVVGSLVFWACQEDMTLAKERYYMSGIQQGKIPTPYKFEDALAEGYPRFSPAIYALDVMLPIVDIAQETHWRPRSKPSWKQRGLLYFNRFFLLFGWTLTTIDVAGFSGLISDKREP